MNEKLKKAVDEAVAEGLQSEVDAEVRRLLKTRKKLIRGLVERAFDSPMIQNCILRAMKESLTDDWDWIPVDFITARVAEVVQRAMEKQFPKKRRKP